MERMSVDEPILLRRPFVQPRRLNVDLLPAFFLKRSWRGHRAREDAGDLFRMVLAWSPQDLPPAMLTKKSAKVGEAVF